MSAQGNLNDSMRVGSGPELTASGVGVDGALTVNPPNTNLAAGSTTAYNEMAIVKATFDKVIRWRLRFEPMYRQFSNVRMVDQAAYPGSTVSMFRTGAQGLGLAKTPLSEYADPDAVALPPLEDKLDVTVNEYGNSTVVTQRLQRFSWTEINPMQAEYVGRNMRDTVDAVYMEALYSLKGGFLDGGFRQAQILAKGDPTLTADGNMKEDLMFKDAGGHGLIKPGHRGGAVVDYANDTLLSLDSDSVRRIVAHLRSLGVAPYSDGLYNAFITPEIAVKLREETDVAGWRYPHLDRDSNEPIWRGTVGVYEGVRFIEGPQFRGLNKGGEIPADANSIIEAAPTDGANILFLGAEGIGDVVVEEPHTVVTPTTDKFNRLAGLGWIGTFGVQTYDNNAGLLVACANG